MSKAMWRMNFNGEVGSIWMGIKYLKCAAGQFLSRNIPTKAEKPTKTLA
jgi:hypothetical protein